MTKSVINGVVVSVFLDTRTVNKKGTYKMKLPKECILLEMSVY